MAWVQHQGTASSQSARLPRVGFRPFGLLDSGTEWVVQWVFSRERLGCCFGPRLEQGGSGCLECQVSEESEEQAKQPGVGYSSTRLVPRTGWIAERVGYDSEVITSRENIKDSDQDYSWTMASCSATLQVTCYTVAHST